MVVERLPAAAFGVPLATLECGCSVLCMVRIFLVLPMDWIVGAFRIERLTSRHRRAAFKVSKDAAPTGGHAE